MFLSAYESIQHAKWWRSYLDKLKQGFWTFTSLNFKWKHEHKQREAKRKSKQWRRGKQRTAAAVFFRTFGALPEVQFLHAIYHFKALEVKNPTLQTVHDLELKWGRYGLRKQTAPGYAKISHSTRGYANFAFSSHNVRITHACCEFCSVLADSTLDIFLCILWCNFLSYPCN